MQEMHFKVLLTVAVSNYVIRRRKLRHRKKTRSRIQQYHWLTEININEMLRYNFNELLHRLIGLLIGLMV
jgi:hypothetical protein